jgi:hypothetical protein
LPATNTLPGRRSPTTIKSRRQQHRRSRPLQSRHGFRISGLTGAAGEQAAGTKKGQRWTAKSGCTGGTSRGKWRSIGAASRSRAAGRERPGNSIASPGLTPGVCPIRRIQFSTRVAAVLSSREASCVVQVVQNRKGIQEWQSSKNLPLTAGIF